MVAMDSGPWSMKILLIFYFFLLPFQWALSPAPGFDVALIRVGTAILVGIWLVRGFLTKRLVLSLGLTAGALLAFLFLALLSVLWSENGSFAVRKSIFLINFFPLFFVFVDVFSDARTRRLVIQALVASATGLGGLAILLFLAQFVFGIGALVSFLTTILPWFLGGAFGETVIAHSSFLVNISGVTLLRATGVFPDPHMLAFFMGMTAPLALGLYFSQTNREGRYVVAGMILLLADLLTFSRGGYVGLLCGGGLFLLGTVSFTLTPTLLKRGLIGGFLLLAVLGLTPVGERLTSSFSVADGSNQERLRLWREAVMLIQEKPLLGLGLGNYPLRVRPGVDYREPIYAHNLYLDIALELGLVGAVAFLLALVTPGIYLMRRWKSDCDPMALALGVSLMVFLTHAFFETPLFSVHVLPLFLLILALGVSYKHDTTHA